MDKNKLLELPELKGFNIITSLEDLENFLKKLRQDYYSPEKISDKNLSGELQTWMNIPGRNLTNFFAVYDEPDDYVKNNGWGMFKLFRCTAIKTNDKKVFVLMNQIETFAH